jgi:hypothetical protein
VSRWAQGASSPVTGHCGNHAESVTGFGDAGADASRAAAYSLGPGEGVEFGRWRRCQPRRSTGNITCARPQQGLGSHDVGDDCGVATQPGQCRGLIPGTADCASPFQGLPAIRLSLGGFVADAMQLLCLIKRLGLTTRAPKLR